PVPSHARYVRGASGGNEGWAGGRGDAGEEAQGPGGGGQRGARRARADARHRYGDSRGTHEQQSGRRPPIREEPEGDGRDAVEPVPRRREQAEGHVVRAELGFPGEQEHGNRQDVRVDRKSTRLNSSHEWISYAV